MTVKLLGGELMIEVDCQFNVRMTGSIREIARGVLNDELI